MSLALSSISCGVRQLCDINSDYTRVDDIINEIKIAHVWKNHVHRSNLTLEEEMDNEDAYGHYDRDGLGSPYIRPAFIIFSNVITSRRTKNLIAYIERHKLGTVWSSESKNNPNSGNNIKVHVWTIDWNALQKWTPREKALESNEDMGEEAA